MRTAFRTISLCLTLLAANTTFGAGTVVNDGSLGPVTITHVGKVFTIGPDGKQSGTNLFYSLSMLNLNAGETASFTGPAGIHNVLTRVTGGPSNIDGLLQCTITGANFFLINPAGVIFGPDARLDVQGSFAVTTADQIVQSDATIFKSTAAAQPALTTAPPAAFGFLGTHPPKSVQVSGSGGTLSSLSVHSSKSFYLVGGSVVIEQGRINSALGQIEAAAIPGAGQAVINSDGTLSVASGTTLGSINISQSSSLVVDGTSGGRIDISGDAVTVDASTLSANTLGSGTAGAINITAGQCDLQNGGLLSASARSRGPGGNISVDAAALNIVGASSGNAQTGILAQADGFQSAATGGNITVNVTSLNMSGLGAHISSSSIAGGKSGDITINATSANLLPGAEILAETQTASAGGNITLNITDLTINARDSGITTGIIADTTTASSGIGGQIILSGQTLSVLGESEISTTTNGSGRGGNIQITENSVTLNGDNRVPFTGIGADSQSATSASAIGGSIFLKANDVSILDGSGIAAKTFGPAAGGDVKLDVAHLFISGGDTGVIVSSSAVHSGGMAGSATVNAGDVRITNFGDIDASSVSAGGGNIQVTAGQNLTLRQGVISAQSKGDGGNITLLSPGQVLIQKSRLTASSKTGNGGNIVIDPSLVILQNSDLIARAILGNGGNIDVTALRFLESSTTIDVSSEFGVAGTVSLSSPDLDIAGQLIALHTDLAAQAVQLEPACSVMAGDNVSTFIQTGTGGMPPQPGGFQSSFDPASDSRKPLP